MSSLFVYPNTIAQTGWQIENRELTVGHVVEESVRGSDVLSTGESTLTPDDSSENRVPSTTREIYLQASWLLTRLRHTPEVIGWNS